MKCSDIRSNSKYGGIINKSRTCFSFFCFLFCFLELAFLNLILVEDCIIIYKIVLSIHIAYTANKSNHPGHLTSSYIDVLHALEGSIFYTYG